MAGEEVNKGAKIKKTAMKYGTSVGLLWNRLQEHKKEESHSGNTLMDTQYAVSDSGWMTSFRATGIVLVDKAKYSGGRLDPIKLKTYERWTNNGRPMDESNNPILNNDHHQQEQLPSPTPTRTTPTASNPCLL